MPLHMKCHTVPHLKDLRYGKDGPRDISCGRTFSISQDILKMTISYKVGALLELNRSTLYAY